MSHPVKPTRAAAGYLGDPRSTGTGSKLRLPDVAGLRGTKAADRPK